MLLLETIRRRDQGLTTSHPHEEQATGDGSTFSHIPAFRVLL
jgi:hypothetical protein